GSGVEPGAIFPQRIRFRFGGDRRTHRACSFHNIYSHPPHPPARFTFHVSRFTFHVSRFTFHVSRFTFHVSRLTFQVLRFTVYVSRFTFHVSRFTFHVSRFTFHVSRFTFHILLADADDRERVDGAE